MKQETDAAHLLAALAVWEHAEASARWVFGDALGDRAADAILDALRRRGEMSRTDISDLFAHHESAARIRAALLALEEASLAWCEKAPAAAHLGRSGAPPNHGPYFAYFAYFASVKNLLEGNLNDH